MFQGSFSQQQVGVVRSRTPPTGGVLRRRTSNASSSTMSQQSKTSLQQHHHRIATKGILRNSNDTNATYNFLEQNVNTNKNSNNSDDVKSNTAKSTTSIAPSVKSSSVSPSRTAGYVGSRRPTLQQNKLAPRVYLPGEEDVVIGRNVIDTSSAKLDIELLENDLGRSSLMMPKEMREKMLVMRNQIFAASTTTATKNRDQQQKGVFAAAEDGGDEDEKNPLPRGSQLLRRLQLSVDRSNALMDEVENASKNCENMLDQLIFAATRQERSQAKVDQKRKQAALAERLSGGAASSSPSANRHQPPSSGSNSVVLTPSPQQHHHKMGVSTMNNLDDTFAALAYSASPPPRNTAPSVSTGRGVARLDDTFSAIDLSSSPL